MAPRSERELGLRELLGGDIAGFLMRADRVERDDVEALVASVLARRASWTHGAPDREERQ